MFTNDRISNSGRLATVFFALVTGLSTVLAAVGPAIA